jgi:alcohol dehydrogenase class IV
MLPHTTRALATRAPEWNARLERTLGIEPAMLAERVRQRAGLTGLREVGVSEEQIEICVAQASQRPDLAMTPPAAEVDEVRDLYLAAF